MQIYSQIVTAERYVTLVQIVLGRSVSGHRYKIADFAQAPKICCRPKCGREEEWQGRCVLFCTVSCMNVL